MNPQESINNNLNYLSSKRKSRKANIEISPDGEKFEKYLKEFNYYLNDNKKIEKNLIQILSGFLEFSKKSKYQIKILEGNDLINIIKDILMDLKSNIELSSKASEIIVNLSKSENLQAKLVVDTCLNFNCLFQILLININSPILTNLLIIFLQLTKSKEILIYIQENSEESKESDFINLNEQKGSNSEKIEKLMSKLEIRTIIRTLSEQILDRLISINKKILLEILQNLYSFDDNYITKEAIEPYVRCLGDKNNEVVIEALKILLFFTKNKSFHNELLKDNFLFRLVRAYKQGIDEMDILIVKILYDLFDNRNLYDILFKNNVLLMLSNYLTNFEIEKNEKYEEVIRNVFEIFKLINKNTDEESNKSGHVIIQNPLIEDENLQMLIFKKAYSLASFSKNEESILSCLSLINIMLSKFSSTLLYSNDIVKSIIELIPPFFKNKRIEIIKYSLSIFEIILNKKSEHFQQEYVSSTSNNQNFSIKNLVYSIMNLVNEFFGNYDLLRMSCRILVDLSSIIEIQIFFLQEPQITILKVFVDNLLKTQRLLKIEEKEYEDSEDNIIKNSESYALERKLKNNKDKSNININKNFTPILMLNNNSNTPSPFKLGGKIQKKMSFVRKTSSSNLNINFSSIGIISSNYEEHENNYISEIKKKIIENISLLKDCFIVISNLGKNADNLEVLRLKGFLDIITDKLGDNDTEILPYIIKCIQGFCQEQSCIDNILRNRIINKILNIYKLYKIEDEKKNKAKINSNLDLDNIIKEENSTEDKKVSNWITTAKRLEVLKSLKIILESDIKLQRTFILDRGIEILLNDIIVNSNININESVSEQLNEMILRVIYVVSCNINKLFLIYFNSEEKIKRKKTEENFDSSNDDSDDNSNNKKNNNLGKEKILKLFNNEIKEENNENKEDINNNNISKISEISKNSNMDESEKENNDANDKTKINNVNEKDKKNSIQTSNSNLFKVFSEQLSEEKFMNKLCEVGMNEKNNLNTYKELIKIFINLYLNRYYLDYFTNQKNIDKVIKIVSNILKKHKENNINSYEILKLVIIFLKFICEEENLIKKFLKEDIISLILSFIIENDFYKKIKEEETKQFYYNLSLVILRLTEFNGYIQKFESFQNFFKTIEKLYEMNSTNGKIYIISIIRNIIAEKQDFFEELELARFLNKIVSQKNSLIIFEFVELIKNLVHSRSMCKRMDSVFKYLINEIRMEYYSSEFKKKMLDLILCLSYENSNIQEYSFQDLLSLIKNFDINMTQKTTLLLLMNFSSLSNNFEFLMQENNDNKIPNKNKKNINLTKKDFIQVVNQLIDSDRFSQILIQRLLINITSIDGIDINIISKKIIKILLEILMKSNSLQDNIIVFSLATLVNIINRNVLRFEQVNIKKEKMNESLDNNLNYNNGYLSGVESNEQLITESNSDDKIKNEEIDEFHLEDIEEVFNNKTRKEKQKINKNKKDKKLKKYFKSKTLGINIVSKSLGKNLLKKKEKEKEKENGIKKTLNIKIINEDINKEEESKKDLMKIKENGNEEEYNPVPESDKEVAIVDYIIEKVPNLIDIIKGLFNKGSIDISSLTIMFCCNLIRKIRFSQYKQLETELIKCVDNYIRNERLLNSEDNLLKKDNGKFLYIAIIKYFVCLSIENIDEFLINNLQKSYIIDIIMNNMKEPNNSNLKKIKYFKLDLNDIRENTINFALVENQLNIINLMLLLIKQKNIKFFFGYNSQEELKEYIENFFQDFIINFSFLLDELKKDEEEQQKINNMNKLKEENDNYNNIKSEKNELNNDEDGIISKNQTIQNILISSFKILIEYLVEFNYTNKDSEKENKSLLTKQEINIIFFNKISNYFESIINCIIREKIELLSEELKNLFIYIIYFLLIYTFDNTENNNINISKRNSTKRNPNLIDKKEKLGINLENNIDLHKWIIKLFIQNKTNSQNDFLCIKLFTYLIYNEKNQNIYNQETKLIKKLLNFIKYTGKNPVKNILKIESERLLNIISFNYESHQNLYLEGIFNYFKSKLYLKETNIKKKRSSNDNELIKEDFILLINMILNNKNKEFIKDDIIKILYCILPSKDLKNNIKFELFNIYLTTFIVNSTNRQFQEDFKNLFDLLFINIISDFSETLFFCDKLINSYKNFSYKFLLTDEKLFILLNGFLKLDKTISAKIDELITFIKMLEIRINSIELTEKFGEIFKKIMNYINTGNKEILKDISLLNILLNFSFNYFKKYSEKKNFIKIIEEDEEPSNDEENEYDIEEQKNSGENEEQDDYDESSSGDSVKYYGNIIKNKQVKKEIKLRIKNDLKKKLRKFIIENKYNQLIDSIIYNSFNNEDLKGINLLSMFLIQEDYKLILYPLKEIGNNLFKNEFILNLFKLFLNKNIIDIKQFSFYIHLILVLSNIESNTGKNYSIGNIISIILNIYEKFLLKYLNKSVNNNNQIMTNENNKDNGATANGAIENSINNGFTLNNENINNNLNVSNLFNDTVTSIYFFCDLVKVNNVEHKDLKKVLNFIIKILMEIKGYSNEQKEILIRYYQELLLNYQIKEEDDLINIHFNFLKKVHNDNSINFIEFLIFGTILINTQKALLINSLKDFLNMIAFICLNNEINYNEINKKQLLNWYKFIKQMCLVLQNKEDDEEKNIENDMNNGKGEDDLDKKINITFGEIENYFNKINNKYSTLIKDDEDLNKKFKKLKLIIKDSENS